MRLIILLSLIGIVGCEAGDAERQDHRQGAIGDIGAEAADGTMDRTGKTSEDNIASLPAGSSDADLKKADPADHAKPEPMADPAGEKEGWDPKWKDRVEDLLNDIENGDFEVGDLPKVRADAPKPVQDLIKELERISAENPDGIGQDWGEWKKEDWVKEDGEWNNEDRIRERDERRDNRDKTARDMERWKSEARAFLTR